MGKSRSATIVIIYLMIAQKMTLRQAYDFVKEKRPVIVPNPSYVKHLLEVELEMYG
jgi:protein-tyrosine phosphatase